jgi:hypothetical protein
MHFCDTSKDLDQKLKNKERIKEGKKNPLLTPSKYPSVLICIKMVSINQSIITHVFACKKRKLTIITKYQAKRLM